MKSKMLRLLPVLLFFVLMCVYERGGPNSNGERFREIEKLWATIPPYPGMVDADISSNSAGRKAHISKYYSLKAPYDEVKRFYIKRFTEEGWAFVKERHLSDWGRNLGGRELDFQKGEYELGVTYAGEKADKGWDYAIGIYWDGN